MNENWQRWIIASVADYFGTALASLNIPMFLEGEVTDKRSDKTKWIELRINGPQAKELTQGHWRLSVAINILITAAKDSKDAYAIYRIVGPIETAFCTIPVLKLGKETADDKSKIGCLELDSHAAQPIKTNHYGQVTTDKPVMQSTVEGRYIMELYTSPLA